MSDTATLQQKNTGQPPRIERLIYSTKRTYPVNDRLLSIVDNRLGGVLRIRNDDGFGHRQRQKAQTESRKRDFHGGLIEVLLEIRRYSREQQFIID